MARRPDIPERQIAELHRTHVVSLTNTAAWLTGDRAIGEEIAQEAFVRLIEHWHQLRDPAAAPAWLRRAVVNLSRTQIRRFAIGRKKRDLVQARTATADHSAEAFGESIGDSEIGPAVRALPLRQRECVVLRFVHDLTVDEIAEALAVNPGTVKTHLHRALRTIGQTLAPTTPEEETQ